jgi:hypothetical protein
MRKAFDVLNHDILLGKLNADDIVILFCHDNFGMCQRMIQSNFDTLTEWCLDNGIVIN